MTSEKTERPVSDGPFRGAFSARFRLAARTPMPPNANSQNNPKGDQDRIFGGLMALASTVAEGADTAQHHTVMCPQTVTTVAGQRLSRIHCPPRRRPDPERPVTAA